MKDKLKMRFEGWKSIDHWAPQVEALLKSGWLGVGYTMINKNNARKRAAYATDSKEGQQALDAWVQDRMEEGYLPAFRYYIAKAPCGMKNEEFGGPILLRHSSSGHEVIVECLIGSEVEGIPKNLGEVLGSGDELESLCKLLRLKDTCAELAFVAELKSQGASVVFSNVMGIRPESPMPSGPQPNRVGPRTGRNEPCPCGSGSKFKRCCGYVN